jgi:small-conductance mechanosensitive channel
VQPLVAGASLAGAGLALGSQTIVKDFVSGFFILLEGHFLIGDTVSLGTLSGTVEKMTLRVTLLRDVDGAVHIVPNGSITAVTNKTYRWSQSMLTVGVPAAADQTRVREALALAARATAERDPDCATLLADVVVTGPVNVRGATVDWTLSVKVTRGQAATVKSWMVESVVKHLTEAQISLVA